MSKYNLKITSLGIKIRSNITVGVHEDDINDNECQNLW